MKREILRETGKLRALSEKKMKTRNKKNKCFFFCQPHQYLKTKTKSTIQRMAMFSKIGMTKNKVSTFSNK
jgi:hypothetical protein